MSAGVVRAAAIDQFSLQLRASEQEAAAAKTEEAAVNPDVALLQLRTRSRASRIIAHPGWFKIGVGRGAARTDVVADTARQEAAVDVGEGSGWQVPDR